MNPLQNQVVNDALKESLHHLAQNLNYDQQEILPNDVSAACRLVVPPHGEFTSKITGTEFISTGAQFGTPHQ